MRTSSLKIEGYADITHTIRSGNTLFDVTNETQIEFDASKANICQIDLSSFTLDELDINFTNTLKNTQYLIVVKQHATNYVKLNVIGIVLDGDSNLYNEYEKVAVNTIYSCIYTDESVFVVRKLQTYNDTIINTIVNDIDDTGLDPQNRYFNIPIAKKSITNVDILEASGLNPEPAFIKIFLPPITNSNVGDMYTFLFNSKFSGYNTYLIIECDANDKFYGLDSSVKQVLMYEGDMLNVTVNNNNMWL